MTASTTLKPRKSPSSKRRSRAVGIDTLSDTRAVVSIDRLEGGFRVARPREMVARSLRNQIIRGDLREGEKLPPEADLIAAFRVSRPTLREAIRELETEGLITVLRGARGGAVVHRPNVKVVARYFEFMLQSIGASLTDVYFARTVIEPAAVRILAEEKSKSAPSILRACIEEVQQKFDDDAQFAVEIARVHHKLVELADKPTLFLISTMISRVYERYLRVVSVNAGLDVGTSVCKVFGLRAFEKLIGFIEQGDGAGAEAYWRRRMEAMGKAISRLVSADSVADLLQDD